MSQDADIRKLAPPNLMRMMKPGNDLSRAGLSSVGDASL